MSIFQLPHEILSFNISISSFLLNEMLPEMQRYFCPLEINKDMTEI